MSGAVVSQLRSCGYNPIDLMAGKWTNDSNCHKTRGDRHAVTDGETRGISNRSQGDSGRGEGVHENDSQANCSEASHDSQMKM